MNSNKIYAGIRGRKKQLTRNAGFTLIELMIAIAIFSVVIAGVIGAFWEQLRSHNTQQQILEMQQNARAAMYYITTELRMAGFDPTGTSNAGVTPDPAETRTTTTISMDLDGNGDTAAANEDITYALVNNQIIRTDGANADQVLANNIDGLDFLYLGVNPGDTTDTNFIFNEEGAKDNPGNIRSVSVTILARMAVVPVVSYKVQDDTKYLNMDEGIVLNLEDAADNFRRIMLQKTVKLRNMGLN